jgi:hypothetical protein
MHLRSSFESLVSVTRDIINGIEDIEGRMRLQQESAAVELRLSMKITLLARIACLSSIYTEVHGKLLPLPSASYSSKDPRPGCLKDTRLAILQQLSSWTSNDAPGLTTSWLNGMAGTGKSAIANTFAKDSEDKGHLGASFFVDRQQADRRDPHRIVQSLAYQLAEQSSERLRALWSSLCSEPNIMDVIDDSSLKKQVRALVKKPLDADCSGPLVILIDGLDECTPSDGARLLSTMVDCLSTLPIKLFVASRSDTDIIESFGAILPTGICLQDQPAHQVAKDVRLYWEDGLDTLCRKRRLPSWRSVVSIELLVELTGQLFIYATTILKVIQNTKGNPITKLQELLKVSRSGARFTMAFVLSAKPSPLEELYVHILTEAVKDNDGQVNSEYAVELRDVLETIVFAREPLTVPALSELLGFERIKLDNYLSTLISLLVVPDVTDELGVIRPFHQSFPDFLVKHGERIHSGLRVDSTIADVHIAERCFVILHKYLRFNICGIQNPSLFNNEVPNLAARLSQYVSAALRYSCQYWFVHWLEHMHAAGLEWQVPKGLLEFCDKNLLHWIEVLSLIEGLDAVLRAMPELLTVMNVSFATLL